jgi:hypothetical protein
MSQTDPWADFEEIGSPQRRGFIPGVPKAPTPLQIRDQQLQEEAAARSQAEFDQKQREWNANHNPDGSQKVDGGKPTEAQQKVATLLTRIAGGFNDIQGIAKTDPSAQEPGLIEAIRPDGLSPGGIMSPVVRGIAGANRRSVYDSQVDVLDALLTLGTGAAYNKEQLTGQTAAYFPQYGDTDAEKQLKSQRLTRLIEAAKANAGPAWAQVEPAIAPYMQALAEPTGKATPAPATVQDGGAYDESGNYLGIAGSVTDTSPPTGGQTPPPLPPGPQTPNPFGRDPNSLSGLGALARQGVTLGLADEAAGVGGYLSGLITGQDPSAAYTRERDAERAFVDKSRQAWPIMGTLAELAGGGGAVRTAQGAASLGQVVGDAAKIGSIGGFGYGEGAPGSVGGAIGGGLAGGVIGGGLYGLGRIPFRRGAPAQADTAVIEAGQRQGIPMRQPDVRPELRGKYAAAESTAGGGPMIQAAREGDAAAIEQRAADIAGGRPYDRADNTALGQSVQGVAERGQGNVKASASALYKRVERAAPGFTAPPTQTAAFIDAKIADLKAASPTGYDAEVRALEGMKSDLLQTGLSVRSLQAQRETVGGRIGDNMQDRSRADRTFTEVLDVAANELHSSLRATNPQAADALQRADAKWSQYKRVQREVTGLFLGKRGDATPESAARALNATTINNYSALRRFMAMASPEERADFAATFVQNWGANQRGEFSPAVFAKNMEKVSDRTLSAVVGAQGKAALRDLQLIANAKTDAMARQAPSGKAVERAGNSLKTMLMAALGFGAGGPGGAAAGAVGREMIAKWGEQRAARMLLNPDFTKALRNAPNTNNPHAINAWLSRVSGIASIAANDNAAFANALRGSLAQSPGSVAASTQQENDARRVPPQQ